MHINKNFPFSKYLKFQTAQSLFKTMQLPASPTPKQHLNKNILSNKLDSFNLSPKNLGPLTYDLPYVSDSPAHVEELARLSNKTSSNTSNLKAENNVLTFKKGCFYDITTKDGKKITLFPHPGSTDGTIGVSDYCTGGYSHSELKELERIERFFSYLSSKSLYSLYTTYSPSEIKSTLGSLGIEPGLVKINVNGHTNTFYMTDQGRVYPEYHVEAQRRGLQGTDWFKHGCTTDSVFIIDGKEYRPNENGHLTIPKGTMCVHEAILYPDEVIWNP